LFRILTDNKRVISMQQCVFIAFWAIAALSGPHPHTRISGAWHEVKVAHAWAKVVPEILSSRLASTQRLANQGNLPNIFDSEFGAMQDVIFLGARSLQTGIPNVSSKDIQTIQCGVCESNSDAVSGCN
jgi:hypothetical protein